MSTVNEKFKKNLKTILHNGNITIKFSTFIFYNEYSLYSNFTSDPNNIFYIHFFPVKDIVQDHMLVFSCYSSLISFNLEFLRLSLKTLTILKNPGKMFCGIFLNWVCPILPYE